MNHHRLTSPRHAAAHETGAVDLIKLLRSRQVPMSAKDLSVSALKRRMRRWIERARCDDCLNCQHRCGDCAQRQFLSAGMVLACADTRHMRMWMHEGRAGDARSTTQGQGHLGSRAPAAGVAHEAVRGGGRETRVPQRSQCNQRIRAHDAHRERVWRAS